MVIELDRWFQKDVLSVLIAGKSPVPVELVAFVPRKADANKQDRALLISPLSTLANQPVGSAPA